VISHLTRSFKKSFADLPGHVQAAAKRKYLLWKDDPAHPSLEFKPAHTRRPVYSVRITMGWRALGIVEGDRIAWFWIGSHNDYTKLLARL
jgi:hypothetical protein